MILGEERYKFSVTVDRLVEALLRLFVNRSDSYAVQNPDGSYKRVDEALTKDIVKQHLTGKLTVGVYQLNPEGDTVRWICWDIDPAKVSNAAQVAKSLYNFLVTAEPKEAVWIEASRWPDESYHVWLFFIDPIPADAARWLGEAANKKAGHSSVEVFPKQDTVKGRFGNLVKLPLGLHRVHGKWSRWLNPETLEPLADEAFVEACPAALTNTQIAEIRSRIKEEQGQSRSRFRQTAALDLAGLELNAVPCVKAFQQTPIPPSYRHMTPCKNFAILYWQIQKSWDGFEEWAKWLALNQPDFRAADVSGWRSWVEQQPRKVNCGEIFGFLKGYIPSFSCEGCKVKGAVGFASLEEKCIRLGDLTLQPSGFAVVFLDKHGKPVLSYKRSDLQDRGLRKHLAERFSLPMEQVERACAQLALAETQLEKEETSITAVKVAGLADEGFYEAIYHEDKPAFLVYSNGQFKILSEVHEGEVTIQPPTKEMCPYPPYRFYEGLVDAETLAKEVYGEYDAFADADTHYKHRWTVETFLTYQTEKLMSVLYEFLVGAEGSGKTNVTIVMKYLMYRALWGTSFPAADIFTYLAMHPSGTIIEDEIQGVEKDREKLKIYLTGYKRGAVIPRIFDLPDGKRIIRYYPCFCFKAVASRRLVKEPAFMERFAIAHMIEGYPKKDRFTKEDEERLLTLRDKLLKWRMQNMTTSLSEVDSKVSGRFKELWTPLLQIGVQIGLEKEMRDALALEYREYRSKREDSLEAAIVKAYLNSLPESKEKFIPADALWNKLTEELEGTVDQKKQDRFHSAEYGDISKALVGRRLKERLAAERKKLRIENKTIWAWSIPEKKLLYLVRRYICSFVPDLKASSKGNRIWVEFSCPHLSVENTGEKKCGNETVTLTGECKIGSLDAFSSSARLNPKDVVKLVRVLQPYYGVCGWCRERKPLEFKVETVDEPWGFVCLECAEEIRKLNPDVEWLQ